MYLRHPILTTRFKMVGRYTEKNPPVVYDCPLCNRWIPRLWVTEKGHRALMRGR